MRHHIDSKWIDEVKVEESKTSERIDRVLGKAVKTELGTRGWRVEMHAEAPERCDGGAQGAVELRP